MIILVSWKFRQYQWLVYDQTTDLRQRNLGIGLRVHAGCTDFPSPHFLLLHVLVVHGAINGSNDL